MFSQHCGHCHGPSGKGNIGPNLSDDHWIHKGDMHHVYHIVKHGVPDNGMPGWHHVLDATQIQLVSSFVLSLSQKGE